MDNYIYKKKTRKSKNIQSNNFTKSNREKSNIAAAILRKIKQFDNYDAFLHQY